jgi:MarR family transcriptional regulator, organic hydroperoxide resistance regulator
MFRLDDSLGYTLNMAANLLKKELNTQFKSAGYDITTEQWAILNRLWEQDGVSQNELALITFKDNASITRTLEIMEKKALISRIESPVDKRARLIYLTDKGKESAMKKNLVACARQVLSRASQGLSEREVSLMNDLAKVLIKNLTDCY